MTLEGQFAGTLHAPEREKSTDTVSVERNVSLRHPVVVYHSQRQPEALAKFTETGSNESNKSQDDGVGVTGKGVHFAGSEGEVFCLRASARKPIRQCRYPEGTRVVAPTQLWHTE